MTTYEIRPGTFAPCELFAVDERGERYIIAGTHTVCARVKDEIETAMKGRRNARARIRSNLSG